MDGIIGGIFCLLGAGAIIYSFKAERRVHAAALWPAGKGRITRAEVVSSRQRLGDSHGTIYAASIGYTFVAGTEEFEGDTICLGGELDTSLRGRAEKRIAKYPPGAEVEVYYDVSNPADCCLERRAEGLWLYRAIGAAFLACGGAVAAGLIG